MESRAMPEWAPHRRIWLAWPSTSDHTNPPDHKWPPRDAAHREIAREILSRGTGLGIAVPEFGATMSILRALAELFGVAPFAEKEEASECKNEEGKEKEYLIQALEAADIRVATVRGASEVDIWMRDFGPIFVRSESDSGSGLSVLRFGFNGWGYEGHFDRDTKAGRAAEAEFLQSGAVAGEVGTALDLPVVTFSTRINSEGGDREFNGAGTLMVCTAVEMQRNPGMSIAQIEEVYREAFGKLSAEQVLWLPYGLAEDTQQFVGRLPVAAGEPDDLFCAACTGGHVDETARFVSEDTILLSWVTKKQAALDPVSKLSRQRMQENLQVLRAARNTAGRPFKVIKLPTPAPIAVEVVPGDEEFEFMRTLRFEDGTDLSAFRKVRILLAASYANFLITNGCILIPSYAQTPGDARRVLSAPREDYEKTDRRARELLQACFPGRDIVQINSAEVLNLGGGGIHCVSQQEPRSVIEKL